MEALEISPKTESAFFNSERLIVGGTFSTEIELELLKLEAFILVGVLEILTWLSGLSGLRVGAGEELPRFEETSFDLGQPSAGKDMPDEDLLLGSFFLKGSGFSVFNFRCAPTPCATGWPNSEKSSSSSEELWKDRLRL